MEYFMIQVPIGGETFYSVAKRKEAERRLARLASESPGSSAASSVLGSNVPATPGLERAGDVSLSHDEEVSSEKPKKWPRV
jgi:hypothetical protein